MLTRIKSENVYTTSEDEDVLLLLEVVVVVEGVVLIFVVHSLCLPMRRSLSWIQRWKQTLVAPFKCTCSSRREQNFVKVLVLPRYTFKAWEESVPLVTDSESFMAVEA